MDRIKYDAFLQEFPELKKSLDGREAKYCDSITVKQMDRHLLGVMSHCSYQNSSLADIASEQRYDFVYEDQIVIRAVVQDRTSWTPQSTNYSPGETVLDALIREGFDVKRIIFVETGYDIEDHYSTARFRVTIFKPSKTESILQIYEELKERAVNAVRAMGT